MSFRDEIPTSPGAAPKVFEFQKSTVAINKDGYFSYALRQPSSSELQPLGFVPSGCKVSNVNARTAVGKPIAFDSRGKRYNVSITNREPGTFTSGTVLVYAAIYVDRALQISGTCTNGAGTSVTASVDWKAGTWNYYGIQIQSGNRIVVKGFDLPKNSGLGKDPGLAWCLDIDSCFGGAINPQGTSPNRNLSIIRPLSFIK